MKPRLRVPALVLASLAASPAVLSAADIFKAANTDALNLGTSWTGGNAPTFSDVAVWDAPLAANTAALGADLSWQGIRIASPTGLATISNTANTLTLGASGLDLSASSQNLTIGTSLVSGSAQTWSLANGRTLSLWTVNTARGLSGSGNVTVSGPVTGSSTVVMLPGANGSIGFSDASSNSAFSGNWTIGPNVKVQNIRNGSTSWGTGTLNLNGGTIAQIQGNWTWTNDIALGASTTSTIQNDSTGTSVRWMKIQGVLSGAGNLTFNDATGNMTSSDTGFIVTGTNTLSGTVTLASGARVRLGGVGGNSTDQNSVGSTGTFGTASIVNNGTLTLSRNNTWTFANQVSGSGVLRIGLTAGSASHIVTVSGDNSHSGGTTLQTAVTLNIGHANALGSGPFTAAANGLFDNLTGSPLVLANALTLSGGSPTFLGTNDITFGGAVTVSAANRTLTVNAGTMTLNGAISQDTSARNLTKAGPGTLVLAGANNLTGVISAAAGTLTVTGTSTTAGATLSGGTLVLDYGASDVSKIGDSSVLTLGNGTLVLAGETGSHTEVVGSTVLSGSATIVRTGSNTAKLALGAITRNAGASLSIPGPNFATTTTANVNGILPGITIGGTGLAANDGSGNIVAATSGLTEVTRLESGPKTIATDATANMRVVDGTGSTPADITLATAGTTDIATLFNGATGGPSVVDIGLANTLRLGAFAFLSSEAGSAPFTVTNGTLTAGGADNTAGDIILANAGSSETTVSSSIANNGTGTVSLIKNGTGPVTISGANSFTGNVSVNSGTLAVSGGSAIADTATVTLANAAGVTFQLNASETIGNLTGGGTGGGTVAVGSHTLNVTIPSGVRILGASITGTGAIVKNGAGEFTLEGNNSFSGTYTVNANSIAFRGVDSENGSPAVVLGASGTLALGSGFVGQTATISSLSGSGIVTAQFDAPTGTKTLGVNQSVDTEFSGILRNNTDSSARLLALAKSGSGSLTLSGANTHSGGTSVSGGTLVAASNSALGTSSATVSGGTLALASGVTVANAITVSGGSLVLSSGTASGSVTIGASGTLAGSGTVTSAATVEGTLAPGGPSVGLVSLGASPALSSTSQLTFQLASPGGVRGTDHDALDVTGVLALDGTVTVSLAGLTPAAGQQFDLINATGALDVANFNPATDLVLPALASGLAWDTSEFASDGIVSIVSSSPYAGWQGAKFTAPELADPLVSGDNADPDGDGLSNALEYAFGTEPKTGDSGQFLPQASTATGALVLSYLRPVGGVSGVTYTIQVHTELAPGGTGWTTATPVTDYDAVTSTVGVPPGYEKVTVTFATAVPSGQKRFGRVSVSF